MSDERKPIGWIAWSRTTWGRTAVHAEDFDNFDPATEYPNDDEMERLIERRVADEEHRDSIDLRFEVTADV